MSKNLETNRIIFSQPCKYAGDLTRKIAVHKHMQTSPAVMTEVYEDIHDSLPYCHTYATTESQKLLHLMQKTELYKNIQGIQKQYRLHNIFDIHNYFLTVSDDHTIKILDLNRENSVSLVKGYINNITLVYQSPQHPLIVSYSKAYKFQKSMYSQLRQGKSGGGWQFGEKRNAIVVRNLLSTSRLIAQHNCFMQTKILRQLYDAQEHLEARSRN